MARRFAPIVRNPGFNNPETTTVRGGDPINQSFVNPFDNENWGAGATRNWRPDWHEDSGRRVNGQTGEPESWREATLRNRSRPPAGGGTPDGGIPNASGTPGTPDGGTPTTPAGGGSSAYMPWLDRWQGGFSAPMSPYEQQGLDSLSNYAQGGFGVQGAMDYLSRVMGGEYLGGNNPNFQSIEDSGRRLLEDQQGRTLRELQSRAAAGGNALSGALMEQEGRYLQGSDAEFQNMMARLRAEDYGRERGLMQGSASQMGSLANTQLGGLTDLIQYGGIPRDVQNQELLGQYADWNRQTGNMREQSRYPDELSIALLGRGYPDYYNQMFGDSGFAQLMALLNQGGNGTGIDWGGLLGDVSSGIVNEFTDGQVVGTQYDGEVYDGVDAASYNRRLDEEIASRKNQQQRLGKASGTNKALGIVALLAQLLGGTGSSSGAKKKGGTKFSFGSSGDNPADKNKGSTNLGGLLGSLLAKGIKGVGSGIGSLLGLNTGHSSYGGPGWTDENGMPIGAWTDENGVGHIDWSNYDTSGWDGPGGGSVDWSDPSNDIWNIPINDSQYDYGSGGPTYFDPDTEGW